MKNKNHRGIVLFFTIVLLILSFPAFSQQSKEDSSSRQAEMVYHYPQDAPVSYVENTRIHEIMDVEGQSMEVNVTSVLGCNIRSGGNRNSNLKLEIRVDSLSQIIDSPQGVAGGLVKEAGGKSFTMVITPRGKDVDLSEAQKIEVNIEGSGPIDLSQTFTSFFPELPAGTISPGYTWTSKDTLNSKSTANSMYMTVRSQNKFEGYEIMMGMNCARITSVLEGNRVINNQPQGMEMNTSGSFTGTAEVFFAVKEGYFVKEIINTSMKGQMEITSPQSMTFPVTMEVKTVKELRRD